MIKITDKTKCSGCSACSAICPKNCIEMKADNEGFLYPEVNNSECIDCGLCEKICPILNPVEEKEHSQKGFIVQNKNEQVRKESTSGGFFSVLAEYVINKNGVVFGVSYDEDFQVRHTYVDKVEDLKYFRNSKYVQSDVKNTFKEVLSFLKQNVLVLYSGTPCQIEGLRSYLKKDYENLITVDISCHAVPSPLIWNKYLETVKKQYSKNVSNILFRDKSHYGYKYSTMSIKDKSGKELCNSGVETNPMLRAFFSDICDRPACYDCSFKKRYRVSDFTMWDCFSVYDFDKSMDDDKGTTRVLIQSEKGVEIFDQIKDKMTICEVDADRLVKGVKEIFESVKLNPNRDKFFEEATVLSGEDLFKKWFPVNYKTQIKKNVRILFVKFKVYALIKKCLNKLRGR